MPPLTAILGKRNRWEKTSHALLVGAMLNDHHAEKNTTLAGVAALLSNPQHPIEPILAATVRTPISARLASIR